MNITTIIEAVIGLAAALFAVFAAPYIRSQTTAAQREELLAWIKIAVTAAEQIYNGSGKGAEKKAYVLEWLENLGFTVDTEEIDAMIESAVYALKQA